MTPRFHEWQLQEAKNKLSQVIKLARHEGPQMVTLRGKETAVILSAEDYKKLTRPPVPLAALFMQSPLRSTELDLERLKETSSREFEL